jgi:hypothetical protein
MLHQHQIVAGAKASEVAQLGQIFDHQSQTLKKQTVVY